MPRYYPGANEAAAKLDKMDERDLLQVVDSLYGRDNLKYGDDLEAVREEAKKQVYRDFEIRPND